MKNREANPRGIVEVEGGDKQLGYNPELKQWLANHPGAIKNTRDTIENLVAGETWVPDDFDFRAFKKIDKTVEANGVKVEYLELNYQASIFRATIGDRTFFIKRQEDSHEKGRGGFDESVSTAEALNHRLKDVPGVKVIAPQLGFTDSESGRRYYVADWHEGDQDLLEYVTQKYNYDIEASSFLTAKGGTITPELDSLKNRYKEIRKRLKEYFDVSATNMFYDASKDEIVVFDINKE